MIQSLKIMAGLVLTITRQRECAAQRLMAAEKIKWQAVLGVGEEVIVKPGG